MNGAMHDRVAMLLHLEPPPSLDDEGLATWWTIVGAPLVATLVEVQMEVGLCLAGPLLGWLADTRPAEHESLAALVSSQKVELVTTPFHGPVVSAIPMDDFTDQVFSHLTLVRRIFEVRPQGAWLPRQVWDPIAPRVMGRADVRWVPVDDTAIAVNHPVPGVDPWGAFRTEREGHVLTLLANDGGAQALRGAASPDEVLTYLRGRHVQGARDVVLSWPVVRGGEDPAAEVRWLMGVLRALGPSDLAVVAPSTIADAVRSRVYLPSWAPAGVVVPWDRRILEHGAADRLHKRMLRVSRLLTRLTKRVRRGDPDAPDPDQLLQARRYLHRAQAAAHYESPGVDDPALRHRGWRDLLRAEDVAERAAGTWQRLAAEHIDLTTGGTDHIYLRTPSWVAVVDPGSDAGCIELGFLPGAMNLLEPSDAVGDGERSPPLARGAFVEGFLPPGESLPVLEAGPGRFDVHALERSGDRSVRAMLSREVEVETEDGVRQVRVHKGYDVRNDDRLDVALEIHAVGPDGAPMRARFAVQVPFVVGTPFEDITVRIDDKIRAIGSEPVQATEVRHVELAGDSVVVRLSVKDRARVWVVPSPLGATVWADWPLEVLTTAPKRLRMRIEAKRVERLEEGADDGVPLKVLEDGPKVGDTVVLQRAVPVNAPEAPAQASVSTAGVDKVSRSLNLVPPRGPAARPQRLPLWSPPDPDAPDVASPTLPDDDDEDPTVAMVPSDPTDAPPVPGVTVAPERDDAGAPSPVEAEE